MAVVASLLTVAGVATVILGVLVLTRGERVASLRLPAALAGAAVAVLAVWLLGSQR